MFEEWLTCMVLKGMFNDELAVVIQEKQGGEVSFFVPRDAVRGDIDRAGTVRVRVFRKGADAWAILPSEDGTAVAVNDSDLVTK